MPQMFDYKTVHEYYEDGSSCRYVGSIAIPYLSISAEDDPVSPIEGVPISSAKNNPNLIFVRIIKFFF